MESSLEQWRVSRRRVLADDMHQDPEHARIWGDRYQIAYASQVWRAARLGSFANFNILADTAEELRELQGSTRSRAAP